MSAAAIRVVSIVEATTVTGPMKPLLMFGSMMRALADPPAITSVVTTIRGEASNGFTAAASEAGVEVDACAEAFPGDPRVIPSLMRFLRKRSPDIIETHNFKSHFLFWLLRLIPGGGVRRKRWIAFHHGYTQTSWRMRLYQLLDSLTLPRADRVVTLCEPFVQQLTARGVRRDRVEVISNAILHRDPPSEAVLDALRSEWLIAPDDKVLLFVGRLSAEKGCRDLLDAFKELISSVPGVPFKLLLLGDGPERSALMEQAGSPNNRVIFAGHQADTWPYYFIADCFVLPSHSEGSPLVLLEALAAGCAIVATRVGGIPETVEAGRDALLVDQQDVAGLANALQTALTNPSANASLRGAARSRSQNFTPERYATTLLDIYRRTLRGLADPRN